MEHDVLIALGNYPAEYIEFVPPARIEGCDNTLRMTTQWLYAHQRPVEDDLAWLRSKGGYCACEVLLNAMPDDDEEWDDEEGVDHEDEDTSWLN